MLKLMDWQTYKKLCEQPRCFSRWAIVTTLELVDEMSLRAVLSRILEGVPLVKPADHRGNAMTDFFVVALDPVQTQAIMRCLRPHTEDGRIRHLLVIWREYAAWLVRA